MSFLRGYAVLLDYGYWLNPTPVPLGPTLVGGIFFFFGWFVLASVVLFVAARLLRRRAPLKAGICRKFSGLLFAAGLLGWLFLFFAYEQLPFFGMRFWFLLLFAFFSVWLTRIAVYMVRDYPRAKARVVERRRAEKYLPRKK